MTAMTGCTSSVRLAEALQRLEQHDQRRRGWDDRSGQRRERSGQAGNVVADEGGDFGRDRAGQRIAEREYIGKLAIGGPAVMVHNLLVH